MNKLLNTIIPLLLLLLAVVISLYYLYFMDSSEPYVKNFRNINNKFDIINLGTSHGSAFVYNIYGGLNGKRFNRPAITPYYELQNYKFLKQHLNEHAVVIIPVSYFSFDVQENRKAKGSDDSFVNIFYYYLPRESIYDYSFKKNVGLVFQEIKANYFKHFDTYLLEVEKNTNKTKKKEKKEKNKQKYLNEHAKKIAKYHKRISPLIDPEVNVNYLSLIIEDAINSGYKPILTTTPYYKGYNDQFGPAWLDTNYYKYMYEMADKYNIPYLDYSYDSRFVSNDDLFRNADHLNADGKVFFSKIFFQDLKKREILNEKYNSKIPIDTIIWK